MSNNGTYKTISFITPTNLSLLDLTTIGGSDKLGNETKIGQFCSGLKYALALFLRNDVEFSAHTVTYVPDEPDDRRCDIRYDIGKEIVTDEGVEHSKEIITVSVCYEYQCFHSYHRDDSSFEGLEDTTIETGISTNLGFDWKLEYALREIWSNMIDEGGYFTEEKVNGSTLKHGTVIHLKFKKGSEFDKIWEKRNSLFITAESLPIKTFGGFGKTVELYENSSRGTNTFKIYKQGILVWEDLESESKYCVNINFGKLDERRVLIDESTTKYYIASILGIFNSDSFEFMSTLDTNFIKCIGFDTIDYKVPDGYCEFVKEFLLTNSKFNTLKFIHRALEFLPNSPFNTQRFNTISNLGIYNEQKEVVVCSISEIDKEVETTKLITAQAINNWLDTSPIMVLKNALIAKINISNNFELKEAEIKGSKVVADILNQWIYISKDFDIENEKDIEDFAIQYIEMTEKGTSIIRKMVKAYIKKGVV